MLIFFDTEFTDLIVDPQLISIGFVAEDGERTFYAELSNTYRLADVGNFSRHAVLPQLEAGAAIMDMRELGKRLAGWLEAFEEPVKLATDSLAWDWPWIREIFKEYATWPKNVEREPEILRQETEFNLAIERAFASGLRRHHALDDAKANRLGWIETATRREQTCAQDCARDEPPY